MLYKLTNFLFLRLASIDNYFSLVIFFVILFLIIYSFIKTEEMKLKFFKLFINLGLVMILASFIMIVYKYLVTTGYINHIGPQIASLSSSLYNGTELYHDLESFKRYSLLYGPYLYIFNNISMNFLSFSIYTSKLLGVFCGVLNIFIFYLISRSITKLNYIAIIISTLITSLCCFFPLKFIYNQTDPIIMICINLTLLALTINKNPNTKYLMICLFSGIAINLKIHSILLFIPIYFIEFRSQTLLSVLKYSSITLIIIAFPFFSSDISLTNYFSILSHAGSKHGFSIKDLIGVIEYFSIIILPLILFTVFKFSGDFDKLKIIIKKYYGYCILIIISLSLFMLIASKEGSGPHHLLMLMPFLTPIISKLFIENKNIIKNLNSTIPILLLSIFLATAYVGAGSSIKIIKFLEYRLKNNVSQSLIKDIKNINKSYPGKLISMGYGDNDSYTTTFFRPWLQFLGHPLLLDPAALMDFEFSGYHKSLISSYNNYDFIKKGHLGDIVLIPKNDIPFSMKNLYNRYTPNDLFTEEFKNTFGLVYSKISSTEFFDIYNYKYQKTIKNLN